MKVLIKVGGTLLDDASTRQAIARQLAAVAELHDVLVVHGGGKQVTRFLEERGVQSRFVGGLRVSDEAVIQAVTQVIAGSVNKQFVATVIAAGKSAVGLSGIDGPLTTAVQLHPDLGFVGKPTQTNRGLLDLLVNAGYLPVIACVAGDSHGNIFNVNADQMAVSCATGWQADKLLFLTDVPGVKNQEGEILPHLTPAAISALIHSGIAHGGMQAKLEAAVKALEGGLGEVDIALGREADVCRRLLSGENIGSRVSLEAAETGAHFSKRTAPA